MSTTDTKTCADLQKIPAQDHNSIVRNYWSLNHLNTAKNMKSMEERMRKQIKDRHLKQSE